MFCPLTKTKLVHVHVTNFDFRGESLWPLTAGKEILQSAYSFIIFNVWEVSKYAMSCFTLWIESSEIFKRGAWCQLLWQVLHNPPLPTHTHTRTHTLFYFTLSQYPPGTSTN